LESSASFEAFELNFGAEMVDVFSDLIHAMQGFDIFHDAPVGHSHIHPFILKVLVPKARFIWVKRPKAAWLQSVRNWELSHPETYPDHGKWHSGPSEMIARKMERRQAARQSFGMARRAFRADTLVLEWADLGQFDKLAAFYGVALPTAAFPHQNRTKAGLRGY
jgi:hypothetical protein